jgi:hypothetical protein
MCSDAGRCGRQSVASGPESAAERRLECILQRFSQLPVDQIVRLSGLDARRHGHSWILARWRNLWNLCLTLDGARRWRGDSSLRNIQWRHWAIYAASTHRLGGAIRGVGETVQRIRQGRRGRQARSSLRSAFSCCILLASCGKLIG